MNIGKRFYFVYALGMATLLHAEAPPEKPPSPVLVMTGSSKPLVPLSSPKAAPSAKLVAAVSARALTTPAVQMKILVLGDDSSDGSYQSITTYLSQIGVPYLGIAVDTLTPDSNGNRLSSLLFTDPATGEGLYQGLIYTDSTFGVCNPTCVSLLSTADWTTLDSYASQFNVRTVSYYTWPEARWGLSLVDNGAAYTAGSPLSVSLTVAGAAIFSYMNSTNSVPVSGTGADGIWAYKASPIEAAGETTTPILTSGSSTVGVTHTTSDGRETMSLTMDNFPTLLHSLAFGYGVINWVTRGVFLGQRQIYINPQDDDILFGDRLYAPALPQCPNDPSCPDIIGTSADMQALANWQNTRRQDPQVPYIRTTYAFVGVGSIPSFAPIPDTIPAAMTAMGLDFGWVTHTWTHSNLDCYTLSNTGACVPSTFDQSLSEIELNAVFAQGLGIPADTTGLVTPFNGGLSNQAFLQAAAEEGITSIISPDDPPSPGTGIVSSLAPSIMLIPRRVTNLFWDVDSPLTGVAGSLPDEYNSDYGPNGSTPAFSQNQTYSQIIDNESTVLLQTRMLAYEPYPLGFHTSNTIAYDGVHSLMTDLLDATIQKYEKLFTVPIYTLKDMRDIAPLLANRASYNASGVKGVYTPGVSVVLTTVHAATIPVTGACSQALCPSYGGQIQDGISMVANSSVTLSLSAGAGVGLSAVTLNPGTVGSLSPSQGLVTLNGVANSNVVVSLASNSSVAVVPAGVVVLPGDLGASFTVTTGAVSTSIPVTISATYNNVTRTFPFIVTPAIALSGISMNPASIPGGSSSTGTVSLSGPAPAGGIQVELISNNAAAVVPSGVTVSVGSSSATFSVTALAVGTSTAGNIVAIYNGVNATAPLTVTPGIPLTVSGLSLVPSSVIGGSVSTGTVTLNGLAPTGSIPVALSSNNNAVSVQSPVWINAGSSSATFTVTTTSVTSSTNATISAAYNGGTQTAAFSVTPAIAVSGVSLNPTSVVGGSPSTGTVTLTGAAPAGGIVVAVSSNNAAAAVPGSVTVNAGSSSATFTVTSTAVIASTNATISGAYNGGTQTATLFVTPVIALSGVSLNPTSVVGGSPSTGTVTLTGAAPAGGIVVALSSNNAAAAVPNSVTVNAGSSSATFTVTSTAVIASTNATISGVYNGGTQTATFFVTPVIALSGVSLNPTSVVGGSTSTGTVTLTGAAPAGGIVVALSSNNAAAVIPASVTVNAGSSAATFTVTSTAVIASTNATIGATHNSVTQTASLTVRPAAVALSGVLLNPATVTGGSSSAGTISLTGAAPAGGVVISLSSNNAAAVVPTTVTVSVGASSATFTMTTKTVTSSTNATISATYTGVTQTASLNVTPAVVALSGVSLNPASVSGGSSSTATVSLTGAAPAGGVIVSLSSNNGAAVAPATVTVSAGASSATFTITTKTVTASTNATIGATHNSVTQTASLNVTPAAVALSGISLNPVSLTGGGSSAATISLTGPAPTGGVVVSLSSNSAAANVPATVTVSAGSSSATFTVTTKIVTASTSAIINASYTGVTQTASLNVTPAAVALSGVSLNPVSLTGGGSLAGTISLTGPAPTGGVVVSLSSDSAAANVPAIVTVSAGSSSATFTVTTKTVTASTSTTISAFYTGMTKSASLAVVPTVPLPGGPNPTSPASQIITFGALNNVTFGIVPFSISATASSLLPVSFASTTPGVCTVSETLVTIVTPGTCSIMASQSGNFNYGAAPSISQSFTIDPGTGATSAPVINAGGIVPIFSSVTAIQPGSWISIYGSNLANSNVTWKGDFPTSLGGTSVTIDGKAAYLWYVSPGQINLQAPDDTTIGSVPVVVTTASGSSTSKVTLAAFSPSFSLLDGKHVAGIILRSDDSGKYGGGSYDIIGPTGTSLGYLTVAAKAGDIVELFGVGFGPTSPAVPAGEVFSGEAAASNPVQLLINNVSVTPAYAGVSAAGLYQMNLTIPQGAGIGDVSLQAMAGGARTSSGVVISLQ